MLLFLTCTISISGVFWSFCSQIQITSYLVFKIPHDQCFFSFHFFWSLYLKSQSALSLSLSVKLSRPMQTVRRSAIHWNTQTCSKLAFYCTTHILYSSQWYSAYKLQVWTNDPSHVKSQKWNAMRTERSEVQIPGPWPDCNVTKSQSLFICSYVWCASVFWWK